MHKFQAEPLVRLYRICVATSAKRIGSWRCNISSSDKFDPVARNSLFKQYQIVVKVNTQSVDEGRGIFHSLIADASTVDSKAWTTGVGWLNVSSTTKGRSGYIYYIHHLLRIYYIANKQMHLADQMRWPIPLFPSQKSEPWDAAAHASRSTRCRFWSTFGSCNALAFNTCTLSWPLRGWAGNIPEIDRQILADYSSCTGYLGYAAFSGVTLVVVVVVVVVMMWTWLVFFCRWLW